MRAAFSPFAGWLPGNGLDKGRPVTVQAIWFAVQNVPFSKWWLPAALRPVILRFFGARIGDNVLIRHRVRILWPWKLSIANNCWIGEDAWILNLEPVRIGHDVCLSQGAFLCTGSHDISSPTFEYDNAPIDISDEVWIGAQALILRGVTIGSGAVVSARIRCPWRTLPEQSSPPVACDNENHELHRLRLVGKHTRRRHLYLVAHFLALNSTSGRITSTSQIWT